MKKFSFFTTTLLISSLLTSQLSLAISKEVHALIRMETQSNAASMRDSNFIRLENYEIPLELIENQVALRTNPAWVDSMIFERDGKKYVRWLINPEDTLWYKQVENFLIQNGISTKRSQRFIGYQTASRSYIAVDPKTGTEFSIKMSTDKTGGAWKSKKQTWEDAVQIRSMTDFVDDQLKKQPKLKNIVFLDEPIVFGIKSLDQAMVLRSYDTLTKSGKRYVPGFSIMHDKLGRELAKANGSKDPAAYWNKNYNQPLARALAEFFALTGMTYDSPHSQNFLVELDAKNHPTGKIVLRDFGDTFLSKEFFEAVKRKDILEGWEQSNIMKEDINMAIGILHGNSAPTWMNVIQDSPNDSSYEQWGRDFYAAFDQEFYEQTGLQLSGELIRRSGNYIQRPYTLKNEIGKQFIQLVKQGTQRDFLMYKSCDRAFAM